MAQEANPHIITSQLLQMLSIPAVDETVWADVSVHPTTNISPPLPLLTRKISWNHEMPVALASIHYKRNDAKFSRGSAPSSGLNAIVRSNLPAVLSRKFKLAKNKARIFLGDFFICCRITETLTEVEARDWIFLLSKFIDCNFIPGFEPTLTFLVWSS